MKKNNSYNSTYITENGEGRRGEETEGDHRLEGRGGRRGAGGVEGKDKRKMFDIF